MDNIGKMYKLMVKTVGKVYKNCLKDCGKAESVAY